MAEQGEAGGFFYKKSLRNLRERVGHVDWAKLTRKQKQTTWIQFCARWVRRMEREMDQMYKRRIITAARKARRGVEKDEMKIARPHRRRKNPIDSEDQQPLFRFTRKSGRLAPPKPTLRKPALRKSGPRKYTPKLIRRIRTTPRKSFRPIRSSPERSQRHLDRQTIRSQRRLRFFEIRKQWQRKKSERKFAGDDLWQRAQDQGGVERADLSAWPALERRQREQLARDVEAFVRGSGST